MKVSVVIPCYYSEGIIGKVVAQTKDVLVSGGYDYQFVLVNDGSRDGTFAAIRALCEKDSHIVGIDCAKNLGQHSAIMAGLQKAIGDIIVLMDDDMQTHPSQCLKLIEAMTEDCDVVFARWEEHKEAWWRLLGSRFAAWSMRALTKRPKDIYSSNYLVMRSHIRDEIVRYKGPYPYVQGLIFRATDRMRNVQVEHFDREEGTSGYTFKTLVRLWMTVLNFSLIPLRLASVVGTLLGAAGMLSAIFVVVMRILDPTMQPGWPSLMSALFMCSGLIILFLGLIGEYLGRLFMTVNDAPQYVVRSVLNDSGEIHSGTRG